MDSSHLVGSIQTNQPISAIPAARHGSDSIESSDLLAYEADLLGCNTKGSCWCVGETGGAATPESCFVFLLPGRTVIRNI